MVDTKPDAEKLAESFAAMGERIKRNSPSEFSGAMVIVGPEGRVVIEHLSLDPSHDEAAFWAICDAKIKAAVMEFGAAEQNRAAGARQGWR